MFDFFLLVKLTHSHGGLYKTNKMESKAGAEWRVSRCSQVRWGSFAYSDIYLYLLRKRCGVASSTFSAVTGIFSGIKRLKGLNLTKHGKLTVTVHTLWSAKEMEEVGGGGVNFELPIEEIYVPFQLIHLLQHKVSHPCVSRGMISYFINWQGTVVIWKTL